MPATKQRAFTLVELLVVIANGGCSNQGLVDVHGSVTLDGKPLPGGIIAFEPVDGNGATADGEIRAGKYELTGKAAVPPGEKTVRLTGVFKTGRQIEPARFRASLAVVFRTAVCHDILSFFARVLDAQ